MKWAFISSDGQHESYQLQNGAERLLTLNFHAATDMMRLTSDDEKRVFFVRREGFIRPRTVLRNEYGIRIAQVLRDNNAEKADGVIELPGETLEFRFQPDTKTQLEILKNGQSLMVCTIPMSNDHAIVNADLLVLTLGWYIGVAAKQEAVFA